MNRWPRNRRKEDSSKGYLAKQRPANWGPLPNFQYQYRAALKKAGIDDFTFHDLRHCALNNLRLAGNDCFRIMAVSGHRTVSVFKRYNIVTEEELGRIKWL